MERWKNNQRKILLRIIKHIKMKKNSRNLVVLTLIVFTTFSFSIFEKKEIKVDKSKVVWKGYKVTGSHQGTITLKSGSLAFTNQKLSGGEFNIDMTSIINTDLSGEYRNKLEGHLKSDDFFGVEKYPTARLQFTKVKMTSKNAYKVTGDLTIKGKTNPNYIQHFHLW